MQSCVHVLIMSVFFALTGISKQDVHQMLGNCSDILYIACVFWGRQGKGISIPALSFGRCKPQETTGSLIRSDCMHIRSCVHHSDTVSRAHVDMLLVIGITLVSGHTCINTHSTPVSHAHNRDGPICVHMVYSLQEAQNAGFNRNRTETVQKPSQ